ncbi:hypothetical protein [Eggerthella sinensis]|uniref:hypothetical protein n=1 Tax=Eggerthella sinensis TaxID=242230 RepID=UPI00248D8138|nr:hypothetical protein [Eggerthella sinensis]
MGHEPDEPEHAGKHSSGADKPNKCGQQGYGEVGRPVQNHVIHKRSLGPERQPAEGAQLQHQNDEHSGRKDVEVPGELKQPLHDLVGYLNYAVRHLGDLESSPWLKPPITHYEHGEQEREAHQAAHTAARDNERINILEPEQLKLGEKGDQHESKTQKDDKPAVQSHINHHPAWKRADKAHAGRTPNLRCRRP